MAGRDAPPGANSYNVITAVRQELTKEHDLIIDCLRSLDPDYASHFSATIIFHSTCMRILEEDHRSRRLQLPLMTRSRRPSQTQRARQRNRPRLANLETVIPCAACARRNPRTQTLQQREPFWRGLADFRYERLQFREVVDWFSSCCNH